MTALDLRPHAPLLPPATIERARLHEALDTLCERPLTLVSAPAGWGKTVLLASWAAARGAAWLTLAARHSDADRLLADIEAALRDAPAARVLDDVDRRRGDGPPHALVPRQRPRRGDGPARPSSSTTSTCCAAAAWRRCASSSPASGVPVVATARFDPDLRLDRLRVAGQLGELRAAQLAFTEAEGAELFAAMGLALREHQVRRLVARTEGWAAGLRLAGLTLAGEADPEPFVAGFAGDDRAVADYLTGEVLDGQPAETRDFLLRTSIADRLSGELAGELTGTSDAALALERLARTGMFLVPLDRRRGWYRYHGLFRDHLRARLRLEQPGAERELHARAGAWLAANGRGAEGVAHALLAGDVAGCDELLAEHWIELLAGGQDAAVVLAAADRRRDDARLAVAAAAGSLERGDPDAAVARLAPALDAAGDVGSVAALLDARARGDVTAARAAFARVAAPDRPAPTATAHLESPERPAPTAKRTATAHPESPEGPAPTAKRATTARLDASDRTAHAAALRAVARLELGATEFAHGLPEAAAEQLEAAAALATESGAEWLLLAALGRTAALEAAAGRLVRADKAGRDAIATAERRGWQRSAPAAWAYAALGAVHWQRDELDDAERRCDAAAVAAHAAADGCALIAVRALRAHLAAARGDVERGRGLLTAVAQDQQCPGPMLGRWIEALGPAFWDARAGGGGPIAEAAAWLQRGDPLAALRRVERLPESDSHPATRLHAQVITAVAQHSLGRPEEAAQALEQALAIASREGYRRPFAGGLPLRRLLERQLDRPTAYAPLVAELLGALQERDDAPAGLLEPLSERERAVLRLLPTLLSYPEIGGELFVAANTVKTHVKSIYRKLDVGSRREAVARARTLRLI